MKKAVAVLAVILSVFAVFASKAEMRTGVQLGYGFERESAWSDTSRVVLDYSGLRFSGTFGYGLADSLYAKAALGIFNIGEGYYSLEGASPFSAYTPDAAPVNIGVYIGAEYAYDIGSSFSLAGGLGFDVLLGEMWTLGSLEYEGPGAVFNARMGIAGEVTGSYRINDALAVNLGGRFAWHFYDSDKYNREFKKEAAEYGWGWFACSYDFFAGVTYSL